VTPEQEAIGAALSSSDAEERRQALGSIGQLSVSVAMPHLLRALGDESWRVRKEAAIVAQRFADEPLLVATLLPVLGASQDVGLRNAVVEVLAASGHAATVAVAQQMSSLDADGRKLAVEILGRGGDPAAFAALEERLGDEEANIRQAAVEMLIALGAGADPGEPLRAALMRSVDDPDPLVRMTALDGLTALGVGLSLERLEPLLGHPALRAAALRATPLSATSATVEMLSRVMARGRASEFVGALTALAQIAEGPLRQDVGARVGAEAPALIERIMRAARGSSGEPVELMAAALTVATAARAPGVASAAIEGLSDRQRAPHAERALRALGVDAMRPILQAIREPDAHPGSVETLIELSVALARDADADIAELRDELTSALRDGARSVDRDLACASIAALAELGTSDDLALAAELSAVRSSRATEHALFTLAERFPRAARALMVHERALDPVRLSAVLLLSALAHAAPIDAEDLAFATRAAASPDARTRGAALAAIAESDGASSITSLEAALADEDLTVRLAAARALGRRSRRIGASNPRPSDLLAIVRRSEDPTLIAALIRSMGESLGSISNPPLEAEHLVTLRPMVRVESSTLALAAVDAIGRASSASHDRRDALLEALEHPDPAVVEAALLKLGPDRDALARCEAHPCAEVRQLARELSGRFARS
jgi:HEAT repeat protein